MDNSLNNYLMRLEALVEKKDLSNKERKKDQNEIKQMMACLESTILIFKEKYNEYNAAVFAKEIAKKEPTIAIKTVNSLSIYATNVNRVNLNYIPEIQQYNLHINNLSLFGNIGTIYDKKILLNDRIHAHQVVPCTNGNNCKNVLAEKYCKFYHEPADLLKLYSAKLISEEYYKEAIKLIRNFSHTTWMYNSGIYSSNTRCIGSRATMLNDVQKCLVSEHYKENIRDMKAQVMHDILVLLVLNENNLA